MERTLQPANTGRTRNHEDKKQSEDNCSTTLAGIQTRQAQTKDKEGGMIALESLMCVAGVAIAAYALAVLLNALKGGE